MAFDNFAEFLAMGKHGAYVWAAYGISLLVIAANILAPILRQRALRIDIQRKIKREKLES
ncbi:MAG: heme exporter protein CcmD [Gammaproteobacteria bacterium]|nr:heme exporter protein CcmD [Gammaproteobacteria bacterium]